MNIQFTVNNLVENVKEIAMADMAHEIYMNGFKQPELEQLRSILMSIGYVLTEIAETSPCFECKKLDTCSSRFITAFQGPCTDFQK